MLYSLKICIVISHIYSKSLKPHSNRSIEAEASFISILLERSRSHNMVRKFIIDTDTGVDDAMALLMALDAHLKGEVR